MNRIFVDTSGWVSLFFATEDHHQKAVEYFEQAKRIPKVLVTTNYVVSELVALIPVRHRISRRQLFQYIDSIRTAPFIDLIHINASMDAAAWALCKKRNDKNWSLVDTSSFVVMKNLSIQEALTTDRHFEQADLIRLLK